MNLVYPISHRQKTGSKIAPILDKMCTLQPYQPETKRPFSCSSYQCPRCSAELSEDSVGLVCLGCRFAARVCHDCHEETGQPHYMNLIRYIKIRPYETTIMARCDHDRPSAPGILDPQDRREIRAWAELDKFRSWNHNQDPEDMNWRSVLAPERTRRYRRGQVKTRRDNDLTFTEIQPMRACLWYCAGCQRSQVTA